MSPNDFAKRYAIRQPDGDLFKSPLTGGIVTWDEPAGAQHVLDQLRQAVAQTGMVYTGTIVWQLCTPFIDDTADSSKLVDELTAWLQRETGGNR